jgi:hypothetical protein
MDKKDHIIKFVQKQHPQAFPEAYENGFIPRKTTTKFLSNYKMHDRAAKYIRQIYEKHGYMATPIGLDLRGLRVAIKDEVPDFMLEKGNELFCIDIKSKTSLADFGTANIRSVECYQKFAKACNVQVYLIFTFERDSTIQKDIVKYVNILDRIVGKKYSWDGNDRWKFHKDDLKDGLPNV